MSSSSWFETELVTGHMDCLLTVLDGTVPSDDIDAVAMFLTQIFAHRQRLYHLLRWAVRHEVRLFRDEAALGSQRFFFREQTLASRVLSFFVQVACKRISRKLFVPVLKEIYRAPADLEIDPERAVGGAEAVVRSQRALFELCPRALLRLLAQFSRLPDCVRAIFALFGEEMGDALAAHAHEVVGGLLILRFACPFLLAPDHFGLTDASVPPNKRRALVLVCKFVQSVANLAEFGDKEAHMQFLNAAAAQMRPRVEAFLRGMVPPLTISSSNVCASSALFGREGELCVSQGEAAAAVRGVLGVVIKVWAGFRLKLNAVSGEKKMEAKMEAALKEAFCSGTIFAAARVDILDPVFQKSVGSLFAQEESNQEVEILTAECRRLRLANARLRAKLAEANERIKSWESGAVKLSGNESSGSIRSLDGEEYEDELDDAGGAAGHRGKTGSPGSSSGNLKGNKENANAGMRIDLSKAIAIRDHSASCDDNLCGRAKKPEAAERLMSLKNMASGSRSYSADLSSGAGKRSFSSDSECTTSSSDPTLEDEDELWDVFCVEEGENDPYAHLVTSYEWKALAKTPRVDGLQL